jgi:anti-sigma-K factor RskA
MVARHELFKENLAAYALEALDGGELRALETHLRTCRSCRQDLNDYRRISAGLLLALPPRLPPATLRRDLRKRLAAETSHPRGLPGWSWSQIGFAGALALLVALNSLSIFQIRNMQQQQAELEDQNRSAQTAIAMLAYPGSQATSFEQGGISGSLIVDKKRDLLTLFAWHLPAPPAGKTYQIWLIDSAGKRTSGGFLVPDAAYPFVMQVINAPAPLSEFTGLGVTAEPFGGSPGPTGPRLFGVDF